MTITREWQKVWTYEGRSSVYFANGWSSFLTEELREFMEKAGDNARALTNTDWGKVEIYYNLETGDVYIPAQYSEHSKLEDVAKVKAIFLRFISRDDHKDVDFKEVRIKM